MLDYEKKHDMVNKLTEYEKSYKYEPCNISEIRELAGLKQVELAKLTGLTQAYLSEVEHGKKTLAKDAAEKIALAFNKLINEPGKSDHQIDAALFWGGHIASFYPKETQTRIIDLFVQINKKQKELHYILQHKDFPPESYIKKHLTSDITQIVTFIKKRRAIIHNNKETYIKEEGFDDMSSPRMGFMPKF